MGLFDNLLPKDSEKERIEMQQKKKQEFRFVGSTKRVRGHTLFSYNTETLELKKADMVYSDSVDMRGIPLHNARVVIEKNCIYLQALNIKNAIKHLKRMGYHGFELK